MNCLPLFALAKMASTD